MQEGEKEVGENGCWREPTGGTGLALEDWGPETQSTATVLQSSGQSHSHSGPLLCAMCRSPGGWTRVGRNTVILKTFNRSMYGRMAFPSAPHSHLEVLRLQ